jgi:competence protein ComEC
MTNEGGLFMRLKKGLALRNIEWCLSVFFLLMGFVLMFSYTVTGIMLLITGLLLLPPLYGIIKKVMLKKAKYNIPWWQRGIAILLFFILAIVFTPKSVSTANENIALKNHQTNSLLSSSSSLSSVAPSSAASTVASTVSAASSSLNGNITIDFIDVGQGDSELIRQGNQTMLIDTGPGSSESKLISFLSSQNISEINYLIMTHPHEDHIGNADVVLQKYKVDNLLMTQYTTNTKAFENLLTAANTAKTKGMKVTNPSLGSSFKLGDATCQVLGPVNPDSGDLNTCSIVLEITFGKIKFLFTGDAQASNESGMIAKGYDLSADVLKVGHHGSNTSTSQAFLNAVKPKYAMIEVGKGNTYGHPTQTTLNRLAGIGAQVFRTDELGTIVCTSDGISIKFDKAASPVKPQAPPASSTTSEVSAASSAVTVAPAAPATDNSRIVYWTPNGKSYHYSKNCSTLSRSKTILSGTLQQALDAGKTDPCNVCVH